MRKKECPKCGSSDVSPIWKIHEKNSSKESFDIVQECDDCKYEWK